MIKLKPFLLPTEFCDSDNELIKKAAEEICCASPTFLGKCITIMQWVRLHTPYRFDYLNTKASATLEKGYGQCTNRANLQIALLRSLDISAGYGVVEITKEVFRGSTPTEFYEKIHEPTTHVYCLAYDTQREKFLNFDATVGEERRKELNCSGSPQDHLSCEVTYAERYLRSEIFIHSNIDHLLKTKPRWLNDEHIKLANDFLNNGKERADK